jgi:AcrR family transcriptional regulator
LWRRYHFGHSPTTIGGLESVSSQPTRRERKKSQTKAAIESAALELFERQGFKETTVSQITDAADVAASTFFLHFATKDDVVFAGHQAEARALVARLETPHLRTLDALREYFGSTKSHEETPGIWARRAAIINATPALAQQERSRWGDLVQPVFTSSFADDLGEPAPFTEARMLASMSVAGMIELGRMEAEGEHACSIGDRLVEQLELLYDAAVSRVAALQ